MVNELTFDGNISFSVEVGIDRRLPYIIFYDIPSNRIKVKQNDNEFIIVLTVTSESEWCNFVNNILKYHRQMGDIIIIKRHKIKNKVIPLSIHAIHGRKLIRYLFIYRPREAII